LQVAGAIADLRACNSPRGQMVGISVELINNMGNGIWAES
jgi:hypothetical protein